MSKSRNRGLPSLLTFIGVVALLAVMAGCADRTGNGQAVGSRSGHDDGDHNHAVGSMGAAADRGAMRAFNPAGQRVVTVEQLKLELPYPLELPTWMPVDGLKSHLIRAISASVGPETAELEKNRFFAYMAPSTWNLATGTMRELYTQGGISIVAYPANGYTFDQPVPSDHTPGVPLDKPLPVGDVRGHRAKAWEAIDQYAVAPGQSGVMWIEPITEGGIVFIVSGAYDVSTLHRVAQSFERK
jgi:hypothetical protein